MKPRAKNTGISGLQVLNSLSGDFTTVVIGTFTADLNFAESHLWSLLSRSTTRRIVLADRREIQRSLDQRHRSKKMNRKYIAAAVHSLRAHHPKYLMLVGPTSGRLLVGSGNLGVSGYAGVGECFTVYEWEQDSTEEATRPFGAVRELVMSLSQRRWLDDFVQSQLDDCWQSATWIPETGGDKSPVVHNANESLIDQLLATVDESAVETVIAAAPFHDRQSRALKDLVQGLRPRRFQLLVQDGRTRLNKARVKKIISEHGDFELGEIALLEPQSKSYIHAKFVLVRMRRRDVLLQGSANLSSVALCETIDNGNVELANLTIGEPGAFDHLLSGLTIDRISGGIQGFRANEDWSDEPLDSGVGEQLRDVVWSEPRLTGRVVGKKPKSLEVKVAGVETEPDSIMWQEDSEDWRFTLTFSGLNAERINNASGLELRLNNDPVVVVFPYHISSLSHFSKQRNQLELLSQIGNLDLDDRECLDLVRELDRILIVDRQSLWRAANPTTDSDEETDWQEDDSRTVSKRYEDIDWDRIGDLSQVRAPRALRESRAWGTTELSVILSSLSSRFGTGRTTHQWDDDDDDDDDADLGIEPASEDDSEESDVPPPEGDYEDNEFDDGDSFFSKRTRRMWTHFIRRFVRGLSDKKFVSNVGSSVIVPTYIIFNSLCQKLRAKDLIDDETLTQLQIQMWGFMWGKPGVSGYLDSLEHEELDAALELLSQYQDLAVVIAAFDDASRNAILLRDGGTSLRRMWCRFLESRHWKPTIGVLSTAAGLTQNTQDAPKQVGDRLRKLALLTQKHEFLNDMASILGISSSDISMSGGTVMSHGSEFSTQFLEVSATGISEPRVRAMIQQWKLRDPSRKYFRVQSEEFVAIADLKKKYSVFISKVTEEETPMDLSQVLTPEWNIRLDLLVAAG